VRRCAIDVATLLKKKKSEKSFGHCERSLTVSHAVTSLTRVGDSERDPNASSLERVGFPAL